MPGKLLHLFCRMHGASDPKLFLATVDGGRTVSKYRKNQTVFSQGDSTERSFTFRTARSRLPSFRTRERKQSSLSMGTGIWRGLPDRPATALGDSGCTHGKRNRLGKAVVVRDPTITANGLISHGTRVTEAHRQVGVYIARIPQARSRPTCRCCSRPGSSWSSTSRLRRTDRPRQAARACRRGDRMKRREFITPFEAAMRGTSTIPIGSSQRAVPGL
jgi:hypothetical protein